MYCGAQSKYITHWEEFTLISLINVKSRLPILKNSTLHKKNPPSAFIDFLDFFHPPLHVYCIYVLVFSKKSQPPRLFQSPRLWFCNFCTLSTFIPTSTFIKEMRVIAHCKSVLVQNLREHCPFYLNRQKKPFDTLISSNESSQMALLLIGCSQLAVWWRTIRPLKAIISAHSAFCDMKMIVCTCFIFSMILIKNKCGQILYWINFPFKKKLYHVLVICPTFSESWF